MSRLRIRAARPDEAELVREIEDSAARSFLASPHAYAAAHPAHPAAVYAALAAEGLVLLAEDGDEAIGFAACEAYADALHLKELGVRQGHQGRGAGAVLVAAVVEAARRRALPAVTLTTFQDVSWNAPWYARLGFEALGPEALGDRLARELAEETERGLSARCAMRLPVTPGAS